MRNTDPYSAYQDVKQCCIVYIPLQVIRRNIKCLSEKVSPSLILPYLECLTKQEQRAICQREISDGSSRAALLLLHYLVQSGSPDFWSMLLEALRAFDVMDPKDIANQLERG